MMHSRTRRVGLGDELEEREELGVGVARKAGVGGDLASGDVQGSEQTRRAVANVVVGLLLGNALAQRQDRLSSVQGLDLGFLVDTDHHCAGGRVQVEPDHIAQLGLQLRIGGELKCFDPVRLDAPFAPDAGHRGE